MARSGFRNYGSALSYYFMNRFGLGLPNTVDHDLDNNKALTFSDASDTTSIAAIMADTDGRIQLDSAALLGAKIPITFTLAANASLATQSIFTAPIPMTITSISEVHATAGNDASAVTMQVFKDTGTQAPGAGATVMSNTFNLKGTANTTQYATLNAVDGYGNPNAGVQLAVGDRLSVKFTGTLTTLAGVQVTVWVTPGFKGFPAIFQMNANAGIATQCIYQANRDCVVSSVQAYWSTAGTDAGAVTLDVTKDTGTNAPGAGTSVLNATVNLKGAINTVNTPALTATAATLAMAAGDRLAFKLTGTPTALAGLVVVVWLQPVGGLAYYGQIDPNFGMAANASLIAATSFFVADRDYEVVDASAIWSTAGTDGGTVTYDIFIDKTTAAPAAGASITTGAISVKTTANTTSVAPINVSRRQRLMSRGDRLSLKLNGTLTSLAGVFGTVSLIPR